MRTNKRLEFHDSESDGDLSGDQEEIAGSNPGCVLFGNEDSDAVFSPNFPRGHVASGVGFRIALGVRRFHYSAQFETEGRLVKRRVRNILSSTWTRE